MQAAYKASFKVYDDIAAKNAKFKKFYDSWKAFREEEYLWFRVCGEHLRELRLYRERTGTPPQGIALATAAWVPSPSTAVEREIPSNLT